MHWKPILRATVKEVLDDDAAGLAAQLSYYFFLSLFPTLLALVALASLFPLQNFTDEVSRVLSPVAPRAAVKLITDQMVSIGQQENTGLLSLGLLTAIWSSSAAMGAVVSAMNRAYGITDRRPWWRVRLVAIGLTTALAFFILLSLSLVLAGPQLADYLTRWFGMSVVFAWAWKLLQWPLVFALVSVGIAMIYHFAPHRKRRWLWLTPGSVLATALWLIGSLGFRVYVVKSGSYESAYGTLGGIIVLMLWFYVSGLSIVIGAELDAEIERALGKAPVLVKKPTTT
jgi:membrane protein